MARSLQPLHIKEVRCIYRDVAVVIAHINTGATAGSVNEVTAGSGYAAVMARINNVGVGGFSTGGGIGYLAGVYGYASDRLRAIEVVLPSGKVVLATKKNEYSDLFWALQGGGGQFGICTTFYQEAVPEPPFVTVAAYFLPTDAATSAQAISNTVDFFAQNKDPFSLMYFAVGVFPDSGKQDPSTFALRPVVITLQLNDPTNPKQADFSTAFASMTKNLPITAANTLLLTIPYTSLPDLLDGFFPYGFRRGFWGGQVSKISIPYLTKISTTFQLYIASLVSNGESPASALWAIQYMFPGLNGNLPASDSATAWPHHNAGHQTLFSPAWAKIQDDKATYTANDVLNALTYAQQLQSGPFLADYPNYISPKEPACRVWGGNVLRLILVKQKYDPQCRIHNGRVFASLGCIAGGWANAFV